MLINVLHPEEARIAIVQDGRLMDLNIEISGKEQTKGNIYKGVVVRVEPGLQAAFVDIGLKKPGFIQMGDLHPDSWQWREELPEEERKRRPRIQEILRRGQEILVQVEKDARDMKGAALTSYLSLPGRYMVLMPGDNATGVSRKIEDNAIRKELKAMVAQLEVPKGYGYIIRTEAVGRSFDELKKDMEYLIGVYDRIKQQAENIKGAGEVYQDAAVIIRTIRDYFSNDIDEVLVDDKAAWHQAIDFFKEIMPGCENRVKLHREKRPIFSKYQLEEQIDQLYEKRVPLPSGGSLVIEPTEALVSIDVNSGKSSGERGIEDTAFKTNIEAANEVARQLRLRDLGGLVVIDFIDMRDLKHNKEVEMALKEALKMDKARVNLGRISQFGIMEMSRQRIAKNINDAIHLECPHCEGRGRVKSVEAMALSFLRKVHASAAKGQLAEVRGNLPLEVAYYLLNRKKRELAQIENDYDIVVTVKGKPSFLLNQLELELIKREKAVAEESVAQELPANESLVIQKEETAPEVVAAEEGAAKKKRKRRRKKKPATENSETLVSEEAIPADLPSVEILEQTTDEPSTVTETDVVLQVITPRKRPRRSRSKMKEKPVTTATDSEIVEDTLNDSVVASPEETETSDLKAKKTARPSRNRIKARKQEEVASKPELSDTNPPASKKRNSLPQKTEATTETAVLATATESQPAIENLEKKAPARRSRPRKSKAVPGKEE